VATVPAGTDLSALTPVITHTGYSIEGTGVSSIGQGPGAVSAASPVNFTGPVPYTVTAEDGSAREYTVTVLVSDKNSSKQITGFYFLFPNAQGQEGSAGIINETAKTIAVTVPAGTNLQYLSPVIYHTGASISPISGEPEDFTDSAANPVPYTVTARDGTSQTYMVSVYAAAGSDKAITAFNFDRIIGETTTVIGGTPSETTGKIPIVVTVPASASKAALIPKITYIGYSLNGDGISSAGGPATVTAGTTVNFTAPVPYRVTAENGTFRDYEVCVIQPGSAGGAASIDAFYFNNPVAIGEINENAKTIAVTVPWDTNLSALTPTIHYSGDRIRLGSAPDVTDNPAHIGADFSYTGGGPSKVPYTVSPVSGASETYEVEVSRAAKPVSAAREITFFTFAGILDEETTVVISPVPDTSGNYPVEVIVPDGTNLNSLTPIIVSKGDSVSGAGNLPSGTENPADPEIKGLQATSAVDFTAPQTYTVTAENGQPRSYAVTVRAEDNNLKRITGFYFGNPTAVGLIDQTAHTITVKVPYGTDLSSLVPTVYYEGVSLDPASGRANNFNSTAIYRVKARNGTVLPYTVRVLAGLNSAKEITAISFPGIGVLDTVIGSIPGPDGKIPISVTVSPNTVITSLSPQITHTGESITPPGGTARTSPKPYADSARNFAGPQTYRITAEDGSVKDYAVSVYVSNNSSKVITGFVFKSVPAETSNVQAVGYIDQNAHTISVYLPAAAKAHNPSVLDSLSGVITYIGASVTPSGGSLQTANPLTDQARSFAVPQVYTVSASDGSSQDYTVTVSFEEQNLGLSLSFLGISDPSLITEKFNQSTGVLTLTLAAGGVYVQPYEWYLNGRKLNVSSTEPRLDLQTAGLQPGQHEIVVVVTKTGVAGLLPTHYTNKVYFMIHE
jgi:hypothetical protein